MTLVHRAEGADPIGWKVLELGAGSDAVVRIALRRVILIPADVANILFHIIVVLKVNISKCKDTTIFLYGKKYFAKDFADEQRTADRFLSSLLLHGLSAKPTAYHYVPSLRLYQIHLKSLYPNMPKYL